MFFFLNVMLRKSPNGLTLMLLATELTIFTVAVFFLNFDLAAVFINIID